MRLTLTIATLCVSFICCGLSADDSTSPTTDSTSSEQRLAAVESALQTLLDEVVNLRKAMAKDGENRAPQRLDNQQRKELKNARSQFLVELKAKKKAYDEFRRDAPLMWNDGNRTNKPQPLHQHRMEQIERKRAALQVASSGTEADKHAIQDFLANGNESPALKRLTIWILRNPEKSVAFESLIQKSDDITPILAVFVKLRDSEIRMEEAEFAELERLFDEEQKRANARQQFVAKETALRLDIEHTEQLLENAVDRLGND